MGNRDFPAASIVFKESCRKNPWDQDLEFFRAVLEGTTPKNPLQPQTEQAPHGIFGILLEHSDTKLQLGVRLGVVSPQAS